MLGGMNILKKALCFLFLYSAARYPGSITFSVELDKAFKVQRIENFRESEDDGIRKGHPCIIRSQHLIKQEDSPA
jgi:hypothetical protein